MVGRGKQRGRERNSFRIDGRAVTDGGVENGIAKSWD